jgi:hypothetical protein
MASLQVIVWANVTPFSLQWERRAAGAGAGPAPTVAAERATERDSARLR